MYQITPRKSNSQKWALAGSLALCLSAAQTADAGTYSANFNSEPLPGAKLYGDARVESGVLRLASAGPDQQQGSFVVDALDAAKPVASFTASFRLRIGDGTGGEGLSFNFASDLPDAPFGEEGAGSGLTISMDTLDPSGTLGPSIKVKFRGNTIATKTLIVRTDDRFVDVRIQVAHGGALTVVYGQATVFSNLFAYVPIAGRFGLGARTGSLNDNHWVDDLSISTAPLAGPLVRSVTPSGIEVRPDAPIVIALQDQETQVNPVSIQMSFNGTSVTPKISKVDGGTTVTYTPPGLLPAGSVNSVRLAFSEIGAPAASTSTQFDFDVERYATIPAKFAVPQAGVETTNGGFVVRTVQARANAGLATTLGRAEAQLGGTLIDPTTGKPYANEATPSTNPDGTYDEEEVINYERAGSPAGSFLDNDKKVPGIPGSGGHPANFAAEILTYLELSAGYHRFGVTADDGFRVTAGEKSPLDALGVVVGKFDGMRQTPAETILSCVTESAGFFPLRIVWFQSGGGASLEFYSVLDDGTKVLINDRRNPQAIRAYRTLKSGAQSAAHVQSVSPAPDESGLSRTPLINISLKDGQTQVVQNSIQLKLNDSAVKPVVSKKDNTTTVSLQLTNRLEALSSNTLQLVFSDSSTPANTFAKAWQFTTARSAKPTAQWDFDERSLTAALGSDLGFGDLPGVSTAGLTEFGTTTSFGIPDIGGQPARVMKYNRSTLEGAPVPGYLVQPRIAPNGGGTRANQWTLILDVLFPEPQEAGFTSIIETGDPTSGSDLVVRWNNVAGVGTGGIGIAGQYTGDGRTHLKIGAWHRVALAVDLTASPPVISKFIDGVRFQDQGLTPPQLDGRFSLGATARLFSDDDNEVNAFYVNCIQFLDGKLTDDEIAALGGPVAAGIPLSVRNPRLTIVRAATGFTISWPTNSPPGVLESKDNLLNPTWSRVSGVTNNAIQVPISGQTQFYRLRPQP